jgi:hypothetical protein
MVDADDHPVSSLCRPILPASRASATAVDLAPPRRAVSSHKREAAVSKTDWQQIQELMSRYALAIDTKDYPAIAACFTAEGQAEYGGFTEPLKGREAIVAHMRRAIGPLSATQHIFGNFIIDAEGDKGRLTCDIFAQHVRGAGAEAETYLAGGKYTVEVRRTAEGWQLDRVVARSVWGMGERNMLPKAADAAG